MAKKKNLIGLRVGKLVVIDELSNIRRSNGQSNRVWKCICDCGNDTEGVTSHLTRSKNPLSSCGCLTTEVNSARNGIKSATWKRGWIIDDWGYKLLRDTKHHRAKSNGYVREHIVVMEKTIGRRLYPEETIHHINGVRDDNRPENLELWSKSHPPGQRVKDKIKWAKEILEKYADHS